MVLPIASVCSTHPPVSVLVRAQDHLPRGFSRKHGLTDFAKGGFVSHLRICALADFHAKAPYVLSRGRPEPRPATLLRHPGFGSNDDPTVQEYRPVVHRLRRIRPRLSSRLTLGGLALPRNPWVYGGEVSRLSLVTHASILTSVRSTGTCRLPLRRSTESSPTTRRRKAFESAASVMSLSPVNCRRMSTRPVSCYALFKCMAASKPTSWLSGQTHILCHLAHTWGP